MRLMIFTNHYPYGKGEDFLENELKLAEKFFDNIIIVSGEKKNRDISKYIPHNATVISVRDNYKVSLRILTVIKCLVAYNFWVEMLLGCKERGLKNFLELAKKIFLTIDYIRHLKRSEDKWIFDDSKTIYYSYWLNASATYLAKNKLKLKGLCVSRAHGGDCFYDRGYTPFRKEQLQGLDAIFPISEAGRIDIIEHYKDVVPDLADKIFVSKLGIEMPFDVTTKNYNTDKKVIVTCSNVIPLKRLDLIIDALSLCEDINVKWIHFGDGSEMKNIVLQANQKLSPKNNISFEFKGRVPHDEVISFYDTEQVDLFVNCSDSEGIPVSVMEAMSRGIPAITRNVGANAELVSNDCGILLSRNISASDLSEAIIGILSLNKEQYSKLQENAIAKVKNEFDAKQNYIKFYTQVIEMGL